MTQPTTPPPAPPASEPPRGTRAAWLLTALVFMVSTGLPWTSCHNLGPVTLAIRWTLSDRALDHVLALGLALPIVLITAVASLETRGRPYPRPARSVVLVTAAAVASIALNTFANQYVRLNYRGGVLLGLRAVLLAPPLVMAAWALRRRADNAAPLAARWIAAHAALALPVAFAGHCDRAGATLGFVTAAALLLLATQVPDDPSPLRPQARMKLFLATTLLLVATLYVAFRGGHRPRFLLWPPPRW